MLIEDFSFKIEAMNSASPLVLVKSNIGESRSKSPTNWIIFSATSAIEPSTYFTSTSYSRTDESYNFV